MAADKQDKVLNVPTLRFPEFTEEWAALSIEDCLIRLENGANYDTNDVEGYPMSRIETISTSRIDYSKVGHSANLKNAEHYRMLYGDILFSHINSVRHIGKTAYYEAEKPLYHGMNLLLLRCKSEIDSKYIYYILNSQKFLRKCQVLAKQAVNQASISTSDLRKIRLFVPQHVEQEKIAKFLSCIDNRINTQIRIIEDLKLFRSAIYQKVFSSMHGEAVALCKITDIIKGKQINGTELYDTGDYYVMNGGIVPSGYYNDYNTPANTISISEGGNSCGYVQFNDVPFWSGGHCYTLSISSSQIDLRYLFHYLKYREQDIMALRIGSGLPNIQKKNLERFQILIPTFDEQHRYAKIFDSLQHKEVVEASLLNKWQTQKQYLLRQMFI